MFSGEQSSAASLDSRALPDFGGGGGEEKGFPDSLRVPEWV